MNAVISDLAIRKFLGFWTRHLR